MPGALEVAAFLVHLASAEEEPEFLPSLRLNRLLYYCQGWYLAAHDRTLFPERLEAWATGPVVPVVFEALRARDWQPIPAEDLPSPEGLAAEEQEHIGRIWEAYKDYTGGTLSALARDEEPWRQARNGTSVAQRSDAEITVEALRGFFSALLAEENEVLVGAEA
jgi:uncharacterized phage-associated protein